MKQIFFLVFTLFSIVAFCQREVIAIGNSDENDTLDIEYYDVSNNLVFKKTKKIYPQNWYNYNFAEILAYSYNDNKVITRYIWIQAGIGFVIGYIEDYQYDTLQNIKKTFTYEYEYESKGNPNKEKSLLLKINNTQDLENSKILKKSIKRGGYLSEISYFKDTLPIKDIRFYKNGDTICSIDYSYNNQNLLISKRYNTSETFYTYDTLGRILSEETSGSSFKYDYETPNIIKKYELRNGIVDIRIDEYRKNTLIKRSFYRENINNEPYHIISYEYDEENRLTSQVISGNLPHHTSFTIVYIHRVIKL